MRWSVLLSQSTKEESKKILRGLKFDNKTIDTVSRIVYAVNRELPKNRAEVRKSIYEIGEDLYEMYLQFMKIYMSDRVEEIEKIEKQYRDILASCECISLKTLAVNGRDLIELGAKRGEEVGNGLKFLLYKVLENEKINERDVLINIFKETSSYNTISEEN